MPKFFVDKRCVVEDNIIIEDENVNHLKNVLRSNVGDTLIINDRQGKDYKCIISLIENNLIKARIIEVSDSDTEPSVDTVLFQSLVKGEKMELVIQKAIEIGVTKIIPMATSRCVVKIDNPKKMASKLERWNKIAESAAKQSGRGIVPQVCEPMEFKEAIEYAATSLEVACIPYEKEKDNTVKAFLVKQTAKSFGIFIGPEGGFSEEEILKAKDKGVASITLGPRILRSETAGLVVLANIMYEMGEMN